MPSSAEKQLIETRKAFQKYIRNPGERSRIDHLVYTPNTNIKILLRKLKSHMRKENPSEEELRQAGQYLEGLAFLAFSSLAGNAGLKNYQSPGPQLDLIASGSSEAWRASCEAAGIAPAQAINAGFLVEAKATASKVGDPIIQRVCSLMLLQFANTVHVGVIFSLKGITGEPANQKSMRVLRNARFTQVLLYASRKMPIVSLKWEDLERLDKPGSLPQILRAKIRDLEELCDKPLVPVGGTCIEVNAPEYLRRLLSSQKKSSRLHSKYNKKTVRQKSCKIKSSKHGPCQSKKGSAGHPAHGLRRGPPERLS